MLTAEGLQEGIDGVGLIRDEVLGCCDGGAAGVWPTCRTGGVVLAGARQASPRLRGDRIGTSSHATPHIHLQGEVNYHFPRQPAIAPEFSAAAETVQPLVLKHPPRGHEQRMRTQDGAQTRKKRPLPRP